MKFCSFCGAQVADTAVFCHSCGKRLPVVSRGEEPAQSGPAASSAPAGNASQPSAKESFFDKVTGTISSISGGKGAVRPPIKDIFGKMFKSHTKEEAEDIFLCSSRTSAKETEGIWPHPWLFSRIFIAFAICFAMLYICVQTLKNSISVPGLILVGSFAVPISLVIFFFEMNSKRNMSIYVVLKTFFVGGCGSLLLSLLLFDLVGFNGELDTFGAMVVGIVEEAGKMGLVWYFLRSEKCDSLMHGLIIGAAVGAGFAAFESAGYASMYGIDNIFLRALLAPGGHIAWAAIEGYAIMLAKASNEVEFGVFGKADFWKLAWIPIVLHATWDMPIKIGQEFHLVPIILTIIAWIVLFVLLNNALIRLHNSAAPDAADEAPNANTVG